MVLEGQLGRQTVLLITLIMTMQCGPWYIDARVPDIEYGARVNDSDARVCPVCHCTFRVPFSKHINFKCPCHVIVNVVFLVFLLTTFVR